jgi:uncharacterized protein YbbK (DUF523 family)
MSEPSPGFDWSRLETVGPDDPLRVLFSACVLGNATGWDGNAYPEPIAQRIAALPCVKPIPFCPENATLGTPRPLTTLHDGNGRDVLAGRARVLETSGRDVTRELIAGAEAMLAKAREARVELAIMLEISDSCGSHAVYIGPPEDRRYQRGPGVAAATLMAAGIPVFGQRDYATLNRLLARLDPSFVPDPEARDFIDQGWFGEYFAEDSAATIDES